MTWYLIKHRTTLLYLCHS